MWLYPHHVDTARRFDFGLPVGEVAAHPSESARLGLTNLSAENWTLTPPGGQAQDAPPGKSAGLVSGSKVHFGRVEDEVRL